jgi:hypothetical protein
MLLRAVLGRGGGREKLTSKSTESLSLPYIVVVGAKIVVRRNLEAHAGGLEWQARATTRDLD